MMKPLSEAILSPEIEGALAVVGDAKRSLAAAVEAAQANCDHRFVSEAPWRSGGLPAMRICNHCRLIEEGSHWSGGSVWSRRDYGKSDLGNITGRIVTAVSRDEFYDMRVSI